MRSTHAAALLTIAAVISFSAVVLVSSKDTFAAADATAAIKRLIAGFIDSWNRHDAHAASMWFAEDGDFINVEHVVSHGRKGIEDHLVPVFAGRLKNAHRTYTVKSVRFLTPQVAAVDIDYEITGTKGVDGVDVPLRKGLYDCIVTEQNGKWLINVLHESELHLDHLIAP